METLSRRLARYVHGFSYKSLPPEVVHEAKRRLIDTLGCAIGAYGSAPGGVARRLASSLKTTAGARVWGTGRKSSPEIAAFANGTDVRYLDYNDTYLSKEPAHPSDNIPAALAVAEAEGSGGRGLLAALVLGYEIQCRLCDAASLRVRGWDHVTYGALSGALLAGWLMRLKEDQLSHAAAMAVVSNNALRQTRVGEISDWKACAFANAARNGVFAASLARLGMSGPEAIFEGEKGFFKVVSGPFSLPLLGGENGAPFKILESYIKFYPVEYHAQSAVAAALAIHPKVRKQGRASDVIESIIIRTSSVSLEIIGRDPEKWRPRTRETADHSLPYCVAVALEDGRVGLAQFDAAHLRDPRIRALLGKTRVEEDAELSALYPASIGNLIEVITPSGKSTERVDTPRGHPKNPMSDAEVEKKFRALCDGKIPRPRADRILRSVWRLERARDLGSLTSLLRRGSP